MREFKFSTEDVHQQSERIMAKLNRVLDREHPAHSLTALMLLLTEYLILVADNNADIDAILTQIRKSAREQLSLDLDHPQGSA
jgi:hypothetical protein